MQGLVKRVDLRTIELKFANHEASDILPGKLCVSIRFFIFVVSS